ncbi:hypothetical protein K523DRAFT_348223 [Schizophyllum commune Tattone D]|nr:hypothetical protein K523DRAFT_348223 [Schizophyllum commune Tattone D]
MAPIIFYDIPSDKVGCWSPNTWKIRYALNFKGLPFRTDWVEYPDIEAKCKDIGAEPTGTRDDKPLYTFPVIQDPHTGKVVSDGPKIARYLDEAYPDTPKLFPPGTEDKQNAVFAELIQKGGPALRPLVIPPVVNILNDVSKPYFRTTREKMFGGKLEDLVPQGDDRKATLEQLRQAFEAFAKRLDEGGPFILGDKPSFADFIVAGFLQWFRVTLGEDSDLWEAVSTWGDGRLLKYLEDLRPYEGNPRA